MPEGHPIPRSRTRRSTALGHKSSVPEYLQPSSVAAVRELAELIAAAEWAPACYRGDDGCYLKEKIVLGIMHGAAVGLGPFAAVHAIAVIDGHPTIWGDGALALVERSGLIEDMREDYVVDGDEGLTAVCTMRRRSWPTPITRRFSTAMAEGAGLTRKEGPWQTYPRRMLMMRARSWALRDGFADVLRGLSIREEVQDYAIVTTPSPEPALAGFPCRPFPVVERQAPRPRFSDFGRRQMGGGGTSGTASPRFMARCPDDAGQGYDALTGRLPDTTRTAGSLVAEPIAASRDPLPLPGGANIPASAEDHTTEEAGTFGKGREQFQMAAVAPAVAVERQAGATCALIDAHGNFVEVEDLDALRKSFDQLFADRSLSADQVVGLWESNETARTDLENAFGNVALAEAEHRLADAQQDREERSAAKIGQVGRFAARPRRSRAKPIGPLSDNFGAMALDPSSADARLLQLYQSRLASLKRRRASAVAFVEFRDANREIEARLREKSSHLIADIEAIYAWAARHAR